MAAQCRCGTPDCPHGPLSSMDITSMATAGGWVKCAHVSAVGVTSFSCAICGPLTVHGAA